MHCVIFNKSQTAAVNLVPNRAFYLRFLGIYHYQQYLDMDTYTMCTPLWLIDRNVCLNVYQWTVLNFLELLISLKRAESEWKSYTYRCRKTSAKSWSFFFNKSDARFTVFLFFLMFLATFTFYECFGSKFKLAKAYLSSSSCDTFSKSDVHAL